MIYAGFDLSLTETGWCCLDTVTGEYESGVLKPKMYEVERLLWYRGKFTELLPDADLVGVEGPSYGSKGGVVYDIGELFGVFKIACHSFSVPLYIYAPGQIKKFTCDNGNAKKDEMLLRVYTKWGFETSNHNIADAYAVTRLLKAHHEVYSGVPVSLLEYEKGVIERIIHPIPKKKKGRK